MSRRRDGIRRNKEPAGREAAGGVRRLPPARVLMGRQAVREVSSHLPESIAVVYAALKGGEKSERFAELAAGLARRGISVKAADAQELAELAGSESHQGFVALLKEAPRPTLKAVLEGLDRERPVLLLMVDSVHDPQNLGAILRAAECFGARGVIWSKNRGCGLSGVVRKAAVGASELVLGVEVNNLVDSLRKLKAAGLWAVAADAGVGASSVDGFEFPKRTILVLGSEGEGLHSLLLRECDFRVKIPMLGRIASLNVSQAAAVLLREYSRQLSTLA